MKKTLNAFIIMLTLVMMMGCSDAVAKQKIQQEPLQLDTKWMGTYRAVEHFPSVELQIIRYEDGSGKYIRTISNNAKDNALEGNFIKINENTVKDKTNEVTIVFSDFGLKFFESEKEFSYEKISPIVEADFKLSNGVQKEMAYSMLKEVVHIEKDIALSGGYMNTATIEQDGLMITLKSNTESIEESSVFGYRIKDGDIKIFRGIGIGSSVEEVFALYGERDLYGKACFIRYEVGQYALVFDITDKKVREILCINTILL